MGAGWIKVRVNLRTHPQVVRIASALDADRLRTVGGLWAVWCIFDEHSADGFLPGYSLEAIDAELGWPGFAAVMASVGWLTVQDGGLLLPKFSEHNGPDAKRKATDATRKKSVRKMSASDADTKRTRRGLPDCPHLDVLALWAEVLPTFPQHLPAQWKGTRADHLRARWRETAAEKQWETCAQGLAYLRKLFAYVGSSPFLSGKTKPGSGHRPFMIELEWLVNPQNWAKVIEGKYHQEQT